MNTLHKECICEIRHAIVNIEAEIKFVAKKKRTEAQALINIAREANRAWTYLEMLKKNGL